VQDVREGRATRRNFVRGLAIAWAADHRGFVSTTVLSTVTALFAPLVIWFGKRLVDLIVEGMRGRATFDDLLPSVIAFGVLGGADRALSMYRGHHQELFSRRVEQHAMRRFLAKAATVDLGHFDNSDWHDRMARARRDVGWRPFQLAWASIGLVTSLVTVAGMIGLLASLHPLLVVLSLASVAPWIAIQRRITRKIYEFHFSMTAEDRERQYMVDLLTKPEIAKEVRAFGLADHFLGRYDRIADDHYQRLARLYRRSDLAAAASGLIAGVALAAAYGFIGKRGLDGELTAGDLTAAISAFAALTSQASLISSSLLNLDQHATFLDDYFSFLAIPSIVEIPAQPRSLPTALDGGIVVSGVRFRYPRGGREVLAGIDLEVKPGELVALVGENGSGKTTIVNLLARFYDPTEGSIRIGGIDARELDPLELRSRIGVLFQDFAKFQLTLRDNVQFGRVTRANDSEVVESLEAARAAFLVDTLTNGLDARLGRLFEGGRELSGGEWQRLAVARLIFRRADLWILDEPTSNLDPEAEAAIFSELKSQLHGRMGIVISHRFSTVRVADRIYVIEAGRVLESGTHEQLVAARGRYAELFELQAAGYR
jgi:ATP-binding cassette, subfamily B, bacterial